MFGLGYKNNPKMGEFAQYKQFTVRDQPLNREKQIAPYVFVVGVEFSMGQVVLSRSGVGRKSCLYSFRILYPITNNL